MNKKIILGVALLTTPLLLTGCGKKQKLVCTLDKESGGVTGSVVSTVEYSGKKMTKGDIVYTFDYSAVITDEQLTTMQQTKLCDTMVSTMKESDPDLKDGIKGCTEKWDNKKLTVTIELDAKAMSKKDNFKGIENAKKEFEGDDAMKCEIK
jgi:hypothetical protein